MKKELFTIKGSKQGLTIICDDTVSWSEMIENLYLRFQGKERDFLEGASINVDLGSRILKSQEIAELWSIFEENKIIIKELRTGRVGEPERSYNGVVNDDIATLPTLVVERSLRSGQNLAYSGNIIFFGDVNPGAEIAATGFIMVWGDLRGTVHAGAAGNAKAWVAAQRLQPTQLRIGKYITRAPEEGPQEPEIAEIVDNTIVVRQLRRNYKQKLHLDDH